MNNISIDKKNVKFKKVIVAYMLIMIMILFYLVLMLRSNFVNNAYSVTLMFGLITIFSSFVLFAEVHKRAYSITMLHWFFCFIFYGTAAFIQYSQNKFLYFSNLDSVELVYICFLIFIWMFFYYLGAKWIDAKKTKQNITYKLLSQKIKFSSSFVIFCTLISVLIACFIIYKAGFNAIFSQQTAGKAFQQDSLATTQLFMTILRNIVLYGLAISVVFYKNNNKHILMVLIQSISCLIVNTPFGMSRFNVAVVYIGLMLLLMPKFKKKKWFIFVFFISFIVIFPMINIFRRYSLLDVSFDMLTETISNISQNFTSGDYDAFTMIIYANKYIDNYGVTFGHQLLGSFLFFIPRAVWSCKPIGSGATILETYGHSFTNGSAPAIAEGLINFGLIGVIIFAFIFGCISSYLDKTYWEKIKQSDKSDDTLITIFYPFALSLFFFMFRGDLLSTFAYFTSHLVVFLLMFFINNCLFSKLKLKRNY